MAGNEVIFKGKIQLHLSEDLLEATLEVEKDLSADSWDENALFSFFRKRGVVSGYDKEEVLTLFSNLKTAKDPRWSGVVAKGKAPRPSSPETWTLQEFPIPENLAIIAEHSFRNAPPAEIYQTQVEKVPVSREEMRAGGLREDQNQIFRDQRLREKILINSQVLRKGFVAKGGVVIKITPQDPGEPGTGLNGQPIPAPKGEAHFYYLGDGLERKGNEVLATESGFLRIGKNWVDLIPFDAHHWKVELSSDKTNCFLSFSPGDPKSPTLTPDQIYHSVQELGFPLERLVGKGELERIIRQSIAQKKPIHHHPLTPEEDGSIEIEPTLDNLKLFLSIKKPSGKGRPLSLQEVEARLSELKIKDMDLPGIMKKVKDFFQSTEVALNDFLIAEGEAPTRGSERELEFLVDFFPSDVWAAILKRAQDQSELLDGAPGLGEFPLEKVQKACEVKKNQEIALLSQVKGSEGQGGKDVFGKAIPPYPGNDPAVHIFGPLKKKGEIILADQDGILEIHHSEEGYFLRLRNHKQGKMTITRSEDNMEAYLSLEESIATGQPLSLERIDEELEMEQIRFGVKREILSKALARAHDAGVVKNILIAQGRPPGTDLLRRVKLNYPPGTKSPPRLVKGEIQRLGVKAGQLVALYDPPDLQDGMDVFGNPIPVAKEKAKSLLLGDHLSMKPKIGTNLQEIFSQSSGELVFDGERMFVRDKLVIEGDVGPKSGNLKFPGEVLIRGGVAKGYYVFAGGFLRIAGPVEEALLSSEDGIALESAFRGQEKGVIRAKKDIRAPYVEKATVLSVGNAYFSKAALNCKIKCSGTLFQKDPAGTVVGGHIKSKLGMDVQNLGNPKGLSTMVSFGQDYLIEDHVENQEKEMDQIRSAIMKLDQFMSTLTRPEDKPKLYAARKKKVMAMKTLEKKGLALINLRDRFEVHFQSTLVIRNTLYPGVTIESHGRVYQINEKRQGVKISFDSKTGRITEESIEGKKV